MDSESSAPTAVAYRSSVLSVRFPGFSLSMRDTAEDVVPMRRATWDCVKPADRLAWAICRTRRRRREAASAALTSPATVLKPARVSARSLRHARGARRAIRLRSPI